MSNEPIIEFQNVTKEFSLQKQKTFKEFLPALFSGKETKQAFKALSNISFKVNKGETLGIIGPNGSGKSTILKLVAGVMWPTTGKVIVRGKISPLIELGAGMHPELTGRENVYLNGAILGLKKIEIDKKFKSIVDFAELWEFIDQPVKHYSSGMYMRLAFAIAIHVDPEILIVDEILAVGDTSFQSKCLEKFYELKKKNVTILIVSHSIDLINKFCNKVLFIKNGINKGISKPEKANTDYNESIFENKKKQLVTENKQTPNEFKEWGNHSVIINKVELLNHQNQIALIYKNGEELNIKIDYEIQCPIKILKFSVGFYREDGVYASGFNMDFDKVEIKNFKKFGSIILKIPSIDLNEDKYYIRIASYGVDENNPYHFLHKIKTFEIKSFRPSRGLYSEEHLWKIQ